MMIVLVPLSRLVNLCMCLNADPCFLKPKGIKYQVLSWAVPDLPCPPATAMLTTLCPDSGSMYQRDESMSSFTWKKRYAILPTVMQAHQSPDEHPRQPQLTHCISCPSFSCSFGTRQIHVERKFVSFVWMQRTQQSYPSQHFPIRRTIVYQHTFSYPCFFHFAISVQVKDYTLQF